MAWTSTTGIRSSPHLAPQGNANADIVPPLAAALIQEIIADYIHLPEVLKTGIFCVEAAIAWTNDDSSAAGKTAYAMLCIQHFQKLLGNDLDESARIESSRVTHMHN